MTSPCVCGPLIAGQHCSSANILTFCHAVIVTAFCCPIQTAATLDKGIQHTSGTYVPLCRPSSAAGTRSGSRHAVLHASATLDPGTSSGHATGVAANAMPGANEQRTEQHANIATQTGKAVPWPTEAGSFMCQAESGQWLGRGVDLLHAAPLAESNAALSLLSVQTHDWLVGSCLFDEIMAVSSRRWCQSRYWWCQSNCFCTYGNSRRVC